MLTLGKEIRLLWRDRVGLFMLLVAPIIVIAAAGFSLANIYAGASPRSDESMALVDLDHNELGRIVAASLRRQHGLRIVNVRDSAAARRLVLETKTALLALVVPAGSTERLAHGREVPLVVITDPVRYLQTVQVELRLTEMCRRITAAATSRAQVRLGKAQAAERARLAEMATNLQNLNASAERLADEAANQRKLAQQTLQRQVAESFSRDTAQFRASLSAAIDNLFDELSRQRNQGLAQQDKLRSELIEYFARLDSARTDFETWLNQLKLLAGRNAKQIPPPPIFPSPPADLPAKLNAPSSAPADFAPLKQDLTRQLNNSIGLVAPTVQIPAEPPMPTTPPLPHVALADSNGSVILPGSLRVSEAALNDSGHSGLHGFDAFDLQVPGFAITFLLIGMLMGISLALIDEREWGTLVRLRASGIPIEATLCGKIAARFMVGFVQMIVLLVAGWAIFGISLGQRPAALLLPSAAVAFAAAAFGLIVASVGRSRDAILPVGAIVIMTMAAIGGCWWPIDFEPGWMRTAALALPTTWAMQAFNDLMIRGLAPSACLLPSAVNVAFGILYAAVGIVTARRRFA